MLILLFTVAIVWGFGFVFTKMVLECFSPALLNLLRFTVSAVVLFILFFKKIIALKPKDWAIGALTSLFMTLGFAFQTYGINSTSPSNAALLTGLNLVMVPFFAWIFYKKRPPIKAFVVAILAFVSISFLSIKGLSTINIGDLLCFLCAISFAIHFIVLSKTSLLIDPSALAFLQMFFAAVFFAVVGFVFDYKAMVTFTFNNKLIFPLISLCLLSTCYAYIIQTRAQRIVAPSKVSLIMSTESLLGTFFSVLLGFEKLTWYLAVAGFGVALALIISEWPSRQELPSIASNKDAPQDIGN